MSDLRLLASILRIGLVAAFVLALGGAFVPGTVGRVSSVVCIALLIAAPVLRVGWLTVDWARAGDRRFAALGAVLLGVLVASAIVALF
jgi:uncharacterized membrane protein